MECRPTASEEVEKVATPDALSARPEARVVVVPPKASAMLTVPVRFPVPAPVTTVTVKVTFCPKPEGSGLEASVVVVELTGSAVPMSSMSSGELAAAKLG